MARNGSFMLLSSGAYRSRGGRLSGTGLPAAEQSGTMHTDFSSGSRQSITVGKDLEGAREGG